MKHSLIVYIIVFTLFGCKEKAKPLQVPTSAVIQQKDNNYKIKTTWQKLIEAGKQKNYEVFKGLSMDTVNACLAKLPLREFLNGCSSELFSELLFDRIKDSTKIEIQNHEVISSYYPSSFLSKLTYQNRTFIIKRVQIDLKDTEPYMVAFDFIETNDGYKFFSCDVYGSPICCR